MDSRKRAELDFLFKHAMDAKKDSTIIKKDLNNDVVINNGQQKVIRRRKKQKKEKIVKSYNLLKDAISHDLATGKNIKIGSSVTGTIRNLIILILLNIDKFKNFPKKDNGFIVSSVEIFKIIKLEFPDNHKIIDKPNVTEIWNKLFNDIERNPVRDKKEVGLIKRIIEGSNSKWWFNKKICSLTFENMNTLMETNSKNPHIYDFQKVIDFINQSKSQPKIKKKAVQAKSSISSSIVEKKHMMLDIGSIIDNMKDGDSICIEYTKGCNSASNE